MVEGGLFALGAFMATYLLWARFLPRYGAGRGMLLMLFASGLFRETFNFRHAWFAIALLGVADLVARTRQTTSGAPGRRPMTLAGTPPAIE